MTRSEMIIVAATSTMAAISQMTLQPKMQKPVEAMIALTLSAFPELSYSELRDAICEEYALLEQSH